MLDETEREGEIAEATQAFRDALKAALQERTLKAFRDALKAALDAEKKLENQEPLDQEPNDVWGKVSKTQKRALELMVPDTIVKTYEGKDERNIYLEVQKKIQSETLIERMDFFKKNPVYKNLVIHPDDDDLCTQKNFKEPISLWIGTPQAQTSLSVVACQQEQAKFVGNFEAKLPLADLMRNTDTEAENFDLLILAQGDGQVLYSSVEASLGGIPKSVSAKFTNLKPFFRKDQSEATIKEINPQDDQVSIPLVSVISEAEISGTNYYLFLQPFQPPFPIVSRSDDVQPV